MPDDLTPERLAELRTRSTRDAVQDERLIFRDPISGRECELRIGIGVDRLRPGLPGASVVHGDCTQPADVSPDLDAFYCPTCRWSGRVSGAWVMDLLDPLYDPAAGSAPESEAP